MRKYLAVAAVVGIAPGLAAAQVGAGTQHMGAGVGMGDSEITLMGSGSSDVDFDLNRFSLAGSYAYYFSDAGAVGLRQAVTFFGGPDVSDAWQGATNVFGQWHFGGPTAMARPYIGASVGGIYGDNLADTFTAGPEVGVKWYVQPRTFILTHIDYQFTFEDADEVQEDWDDGRFNYHVGVGYNF